LVERIGTKQFVRSPIRTNKDNMQPVTAPPTINQNGN